tara:strand:+ start:148 stop:741 length:594 start_codon:yes stop_codon:yes gene_type:complete
MIEIASPYVPNAATPQPVEYGAVLRASHGGKAQQLIRPGSRFRARVSWPPMKPDAARILLSRLLAALDTGVRIIWPLIGVNQGVSGAPVVDGAGQTGTTIAIRGLTAGAVVKEGYWISLIDGAGQHYLHNARADRVASGGGLISLPIFPALRASFADGASVLISQPKFEGLIIDAFSWDITIEKVIEGISLIIEEAA